MCFPFPQFTTTFFIIISSGIVPPETLMNKIISFVKQNSIVKTQAELLSPTVGY